MDLDKAIKSRSSVRKFSSKKPDWRDIVEAVDAARFAPTAGNNYTLKFVVVDDKEVINEIAAACQQDFIAQAAYVVVVCSNASRLVNAYGPNGEMYANQQAGAAIQNFLLKIEESGLSTCWVGYFVEDEIQHAIKVPANVNAKIEAVFPIGFAYDKKRTRKAPVDLDNILFFNKYGNKRMGKQKAIDA